MLFLATTDEALLRAAGLIQLRASGYVEPIVPPPLPFHILAQQIMALSLQEGGIGRYRWKEWIGRMPGFAAMADEDVEAVLGYMLGEGILFEDGGVLSMGVEGEDQYGWRNFMELFSVFTSPPLFRVLHGRAELGEVHRSSFEVKQNQVPVLVLAGRSWVVRHVDWDARIAYVEPSQSDGRSRWPGAGQPLRTELCHAIRDVLAGEAIPGAVSQRASKQLEALCEEFAWVERGSTAVVRTADGVAWWTFAGLLANASLRAELGQLARREPRGDNLEVALEEVATTDLERAIGSLRSVPTTPPPVAEEAIAGLKFSRCLPLSLAVKSLEARLSDAAGRAAALRERTRFVGV